MKDLKEIMKAQFIDLCSKFSSDSLYSEELWENICHHYSDIKRYYHTLDHLASMFKIINEYGYKLENKEAVLFAVWFHDIIYNSNKSNNEEQSADYANRSLQKLNVPQEVIIKVESMILLTKNHTTPIKIDFDTKLFLDADLSILGSSSEEYKKYKENVRNEYKNYPDVLFNSGRKKVLRHFLEKQRIYQTEELSNKLEKKAKENLTTELKQLSL